MEYDRPELQDGITRGGTANDQSPWAMTRTCSILAAVYELSNCVPDKGLSLGRGSSFVWTEGVGNAGGAKMYLAKGQNMCAMASGVASVTILLARTASDRTTVRRLDHVPRHVLIFLGQRGSDNAG